MGEGSAGVVWFAAPGFRVLSVNDSESDVVIDIETDADGVGCHGCGVIAKSKDRRWVTLRDAPCGERPVTLRWWKRVRECREPACPVKTWTEQRPDLVLPRRSLTERVGRWATDRVCRRRAMRRQYRSSLLDTLTAQDRGTVATARSRGRPKIRGG